MGTCVLGLVATPFVGDWNKPWPAVGSSPAQYAAFVSAETPLRPGSTVESRGGTYRLDVLRGNEMSPLLPLLHDAFPGKLFTQDWLTKKYACENEGLSGFACVAYDESGTAAGSVGVLPWPVRY